MPMGVYTALKRDSALAKAVSGAVADRHLLPTFLIGVLLIYLFAVHVALAAVLRSRRRRAYRLLVEDRSR